MRHNRAAQKDTICLQKNEITFMGNTIHNSPTNNPTSTSTFKL